VLGVVYDNGSVSAAELAAGLAGLGPVTFLVPASDHVDRMRPVLAELGQVVELTADAGTGLTGVVTFSELMVRHTAELAAKAGLDYHTPETARALTDKLCQRSVLQAAGVDSVRHRAVDDDLWSALQAVGLPAVVKPVVGQGSRDTHLVTDESTAKALAGSVGPGTVVEEYLVGRPSRPFGDYVSVESLTRAGESTHLAVTGKYPLVPPFREVGQFWPAPLPPDELDQVTGLVDAALRALGVRTGLTHTEVKLTADGPRIIEVNGRLGGHIHELAKRSCGVDLVRVAAQVALGEPVRAEPLLPARVHFQYNGTGPVEAGRLTEILGVRSVRGTPGVTGYRGYVRAGEHLPGGVMTRQLDLLCGDAVDHETMFGVLDEALAHLSYRFALDDGREVLLPAVRPWAC
jgi:biotin carboxylase